MNINSIEPKNKTNFILKSALQGFLIYFITGIFSVFLLINFSKHQSNPHIMIELLYLFLGIPFGFIGCIIGTVLALFLKNNILKKLLIGVFIWGVICIIWLILQHS